MGERNLKTGHFFLSECHRPRPHHRLHRPQRSKNSQTDPLPHFPDADQYRSLLSFNIRHNYYHLIVKVDYRAKLLMVKEFLTHKEYTRGDWKKWAR